MSQKKILIVDDSRTALMMTSMVLQKGPYELVTAKDGAEGVSTALTEHPDLIVMDVVMPNMDGFEAVRRLREEATTRETPIIMLTTRGESNNVETGFECGCNDYVTKPVNGVELMAKVKSHLTA